MKKRILYGLASEGMGHAIRSKVILSRLVQQYDVKIVCAGNPFKVLSGEFDNVCEIVGTKLAYRDNRLSFHQTLLDNLKIASRAIAENSEVLWDAFTRFKPDLVITDFESLSSLFADLSRKPLISIDNMQVIDRCKITYPRDVRLHYLLTRKLVHDRVPRAAHYIITSFFRVDVRKRYAGKVSIVPPILRENILAIRPQRKNHILVYQTSNTSSKLAGILKNSNENYVVYGFNKEERDGNLQFRTFDEIRFIQDLTSSKAVLLNGGYTTIGEAIYFRKPVLSVPIGKHFEQILNAFYLQKMGYGEYCPQLTEAALARFLGNLDAYSGNLANCSQKGNEVLFDILENMISELVKS